MLLHQDEFILSKISEQVDGLIYQFQLFRSGRNSFPFASQGIMDIYEVTPEEVQEDGSIVFDRTYYEDKKLLLDTLKHSTKTLTKWTLDYRVDLPNKGVRWLRGNGQPEAQADGSIIWHGYIKDITERKNAELELLENKLRMEFALENSDYGVWDWKVQENSAFFSKQLKKILGFEPHEIVDPAKDWTQRVHPEDLSGYLDKIVRHFKGETKYYENEQRIRCKDGSYKWILDRGKAIERDKGGKVTRVIGTYSDISWIKEKEEELKNTIDIIGEQNKRLLNFAHIVSHNLKNHSGNFQMSLDLLNSAITKEEKEETVGYLRTISDSLSDTINHLNEIVAIQVNAHQQKECLNLHKFIKDNIDLLQGEISSRKANVINKVDPELCIDHLPAYLDSILLNLLSNALKYSVEGRNPVIEFWSENIDGKKILYIQDNGKGIDLEKFKSHVFGMYQTFHGNSDAVGIGLFITKNQVEAMGGTIELESKLGEGTTFRITFA